MVLRRLGKKQRPRTGTDTQWHEKANKRRQSELSNFEDHYVSCFSNRILELRTSHACLGKWRNWWSLFCFQITKDNAVQYLEGNLDCDKSLQVLLRKEICTMETERHHAVSSAWRLKLPIKNVWNLGNRVGKLVLLKQKWECCMLRCQKVLTSTTSAGTSTDSQDV